MRESSRCGTRANLGQGAAGGRTTEAWQEEVSGVISTIDVNTKKGGEKTNLIEGDTAVSQAKN